MHSYDPLIFCPSTQGRYIHLYMIAVALSHHLTHARLIVFWAGAMTLFEVIHFAFVADTLFTAPAIGLPLDSDDVILV